MRLTLIITLAIATLAYFATLAVGLPTGDPNPKGRTLPDKDRTKPTVSESVRTRPVTKGKTATQVHSKSTDKKDQTSSLSGSKGGQSVSSGHVSKGQTSSPLPNSNESSDSSKGNNSKGTVVVPPKGGKRVSGGLTQKSEEAKRIQAQWKAGCVALAKSNGAQVHASYVQFQNGVPKGTCQLSHGNDKGERSLTDVSSKLSIA